MVVSKPSFDFDNLPKVYARAFPRSEAKMQKIVCFKAGNAAGAICFSAPFDRNIGGVRERTQNILVVVGDKVVYSAGPANVTYSGMQTVKVERTNTKDPNQLVGTSPLPLTTVAVDFGKNIFVVVNSKGLAFRGAQSQILRSQSRGIKDVGSDYDLSSGDSLCVFDLPGTLAAFMAADEIERERKSPLPPKLGMKVDAIDRAEAYDSLVEREIKIGQAALSKNDGFGDLAKRCEQLEDVLNSGTSLPGDSVRAAIATIVFNSRELGNEEYRSLVGKIRARCAAKKPNENKLKIAEQISAEHIRRCSEE